MSNSVYKYALRLLIRQAVCLVLLTLTVSELMAQVVASKQIYLWDVTLSMKDNGIWNQVKEQLSVSISEIQDKSTEVIIVPFQDDVYEEKRIVAGNATALSELLAWIDSYDVPMPKGGHGTNICRALERAEDFVLNESIDCVFLLTDGAHEPKRPEMQGKYPASCLEDYLSNRWCAYATELDAYLVYYQLLGGMESNIKQVTEETCRMISVQPGDGSPDRLYYITPQVNRISKDRHFLESGKLQIPITTSVPKEFWPNCKISATLEGQEFSEECGVSFNGANLNCELDSESLEKLVSYCANDSEYCELVLKLNLSDVDELMVVLTADEIPFRMKNGGERWFEIKVLAE